MNHDNSIFYMNKQLLESYEKKRAQLNQQSDHITNNLHSIEQLLQNLMSKLKASLDNTLVQSQKKLQQHETEGSIQQLASIMLEYTQYIYKEIQKVNQQFSNFTKKNFAIDQCQYYHQIYQLPIQLQLEEDHSENIQQYFRNIDKISDLPPSTINRIVQLFGTSQLQYRTQNVILVDSQNQYSSIDMQQNTNYQKFNNFSFANSGSISDNNFEESVSFGYHFSPTNNCSTVNEQEIKTPTFHGKCLQSLQLEHQENSSEICNNNKNQYIQSQSSNSEAKHSSSENQLTKSGNFKKIKSQTNNTNKSHQELKVVEVSLSDKLYEKPRQVIPFHGASYHIQCQIYNIKIDSKGESMVQKCEGEQPQPQQQPYLQKQPYLQPYIQQQPQSNINKSKHEPQLIFSNDHNFNTDLNHKYHNGKRIYELFKEEYPSIAREDNYYALGGVRMPKKISLQSFSETQFSGGNPPLRSNDVLTPREHMNWSTSIESFVIGSKHKTPNESQIYNLIPKLRHLQSEKKRMIQEQSSENDGNSPLYIRYQIPQYQIQEPKSAKVQSLGSLPELNFCGSSEINDHNSQAATISHVVTEKTQSILRSINTQDNDFSLKFKQSCIVKDIKKSGKKYIDPTGSIYGSLAQFSQKPNKSNEVKKSEEKRKNKVYIIEAESSSQGSRTEREMYISQVKKNQEDKKSSSPNKSGSYEKSPHFDEHKPEQLNLQFKQKNQKWEREAYIDAEAFYEMQEQKINLEEQKLQIVEQLSKAEAFTQSLKSQLLKKESKLRNVQQSYQNKLSIIINQISQYQQKLLGLEDQLKDKTQKQRLLVQGLHDTNKLLIGINQELEEKAHHILELEENIEKLELWLQEKNQVIRAQAEEKKVLLQELELQRKNQINLLLIELNQMKQINISDLLKLQKKSKQIQQLTLALELQKQDYEQTIQTYEEALLSQKQQEYINAYQNQLQKLHNKYSENIQKQIIAVNTLQTQNQQLKHQLQERTQSYQSVKYALAIKDKEIMELKCNVDQHKSQSTKLSNLLSEKSLLQIQYLRKELITTYSKLESAESYIDSFKRKQPNEAVSDIHLQFYHNLSENIEAKKYNSELESIINQYEQIILKNYLVIKQLQDLVYEYLHDGIQKEEAEEQLEQQLKHYRKQNKILIREKMNAELEIKKMKKTIAASERKISAIGDRLVNAAKNKLKDYSEQTSNQTHLNIILRRQAN